MVFALVVRSGLQSGGGDGVPTGVVCRGVLFRILVRHPLYVLIKQRAVTGLGSKAFGAVQARSEDFRKMLQCATSPVPRYVLETFSDAQKWEKEREATSVVEGLFLMVRASFKPDPHDGTSHKCVHDVFVQFLATSATTWR